MDVKLQTIHMINSFPLFKFKTNSKTDLKMVCMEIEVGIIGTTFTKRDK
jgi:hypothetical protein